MSDGKVMNIRFMDIFCITTEEFEELDRVLKARAMVGEVTIIEKIAYRLWEENGPRYHEIMRDRRWRKEHEESLARVVNGHGHCLHTAEEHERDGWTCDFWPVGGPCCEPR